MTLERHHSNNAKLLGKFLIEIANADNTDAIFQIILENGKPLFGYSSAFKDSAKEVSLPFLVYSNLPINERKLLRLYKVEFNLLLGIQSEFYNESFTNLIDYNCESETFYYRASEEDTLSSITIDELKSGYLFELSQMEIINAKKLMKMGRLIKTTEMEVPTERHDILRKMMEDFEVIKANHKRMQKVQEALINVFDDLNEGKSLKENKMFDHFLKSYKETSSIELVLENNGEYRYIFSTPNESDFFKQKDNTVQYFEWVMPYRALIIYCVIEFFKINRNRNLIRRCERCRKFFIASKIDLRIKKCPSCSKKNTMTKEERRIYQREYYKRKSLEKQKARMEERINRYMKRLDISREEALDIIEADSKV